MTLPVAFTHNFIPSFQNEVYFPPDDPNTAYHHKTINNRINDYCQLIFDRIKEFANKDINNPFPSFRTFLDKYGARLPKKVVDEIVKVFNKMAIRLEFIDGTDVNFELFPKSLNKDILGTYPFASWRYDNPYLFAGQKVTEPKKPSFVYPREEHLKVFWEAAQRGDGTDVVLKVAEQKFPAHHCFVSKHSKIASMKGQEIELTGDKPELFYCLYYFIYNGVLPPEQKLTLTTLDQINQIAAKYQVEPLCKLTQDLFDVECTNLAVTKENFAESFELASKSPTLLEKCLNFASQSDVAVAMLSSKLDDQNSTLVLKAALAGRTTSP